MTYEHSLSTSGALKEGVTLEQLAAAFQPLFKYFGYDDGPAAFQQKAELYEDHEFHWLPETREFAIFTRGEVGIGFEDIVRKTANNLGPLVRHPGEFELENQSTADRDEAVQVIAYGESRDVIDRFVAERDIGTALSLMERHLDVSVMAQIRTLIGRNPDFGIGESMSAQKDAARCKAKPERRVTGLRP